MGCNCSGSSVRLMFSEIAPQCPVQVANCKEISAASLPLLPCVVWAVGVYSEVYAAALGPVASKRLKICARNCRETNYKQLSAE